MDLLQQYGPVMSMVLAFVFTVLFSIRAFSQASLKTVAAQTGSQEALTTLALDGTKQAQDAMKQVIEKTGVIGQLKERLAAVEAQAKRVPELEGEVQTLKSNLATLEAQYNEVSQQLLLVQDERDTYKAERDAFAQQSDIYKQERDKLQVQVADLTQRLDELEDKIADFKQTGELTND